MNFAENYFSGFESETAIFQYDNFDICFGNASFRNDSAELSRITFKVGNIFVLY